ncbi:MAG: hypothetical protein JEY99_13310 [Spirochaetales bacterium]|nr:hypothetical protein [Spirochaetales bacterium]
MMEELNRKTGKLLDTMQTQNLLLKKYRDREEELRQFMKEQNWDEMNLLLERLDLLSNEINTLDIRRDFIFNELLDDAGIEGKRDFYQLVVRLPINYREELAAEFRKMKIIITQIEGISWAIDVYIRSVGDTVNQVLNEFYPHRKGNLYSKTGVSVPVESNPVVFNREL